MRQALIDHADLDRGRSVLRAEASSGRHANAHRWEKIIPDHVVVLRLIREIRVFPFRHKSPLHPRVRDVDDPRRRHCLYARHCGKCRFQPFVQSHVLPRRILRPRRVDLQQQKMIGAESHIHGAQPGQRAQKQSRPDHQQRRQGDLESDQRPAAQSLPPSRRRLRALFQPVIHVIPRSRQRRRKPKQNSRQHGHCRSESKNAPIKVHVDPDRLPGILDHPRQRISAEISNHQPQGPTHSRQRQALHQHLAQDARAPRSQRQPHAHFPLPLRPARQHQVGNVGARQQQHQSHQRHQHRHWLGKGPFLRKQAPAPVAQIDARHLFILLDRHRRIHRGG